MPAPGPMEGSGVALALTHDELDVVFVLLAAAETKPQ